MLISNLVVVKYFEDVKSPNWVFVRSLSNINKCC